MMGLTWWQILLGAVVGLLILMVLVIIHELGHAILAKRNGVEVEEFGIGFPPRALVLGKVKGTLVTLNWLPLGGSCKMKGESDDAKGKGTYGAASLWAKAKILLAGVTWNFITACVLFTILAFWGIPKIASNQFAIASDNHGEKGTVSIYSVVKDSPADKAGLRKGDELVSVAGTDVELSSEVPKLTKQHADETVDIVINRDGQSQTVAADIKSNDDGQGRLGITTEQKTSGTVKATWSAPIVGIVSALQFFWLTLCGLWDIVVSLFSGLIGLIISSPTASSELAVASSGVSGPVGILGQIFPSAVFAGPLMLLYISGVISISLAVMNLLPIPGLDGGRLYLTLWYRARGKKLTKEREEQ
ncbi:MAG: M50 family metallopeptidase, partial [Candidatus Saccharibacteria bacterium]|nr:M50 family metallopeptidase [Candidatus Saccharibacteria bacterium]